MTVDFGHSVPSPRRMNRSATRSSLGQAGRLDRRQVPADVKLRSVSEDHDV